MSSDFLLIFYTKLQFPSSYSKIFNQFIPNEPWLQLSSIAYVLNIFVEFLCPTQTEITHTSASSFPLCTFDRLFGLGQASILSILTFPDITHAFQLDDFPCKFCRLISECNSWHYGSCSLAGSRHSNTFFLAKSFVFSFDVFFMKCSQVSKI